MTIVELLQNYLPPEYQERLEPCPCNKRGIDLYNQRQVYEYASTLPGVTSILDLGCGCGCGAKLLKYFADRETLGVDLPATVQWLQQKYPNKQWTTVDLFIDTLSGFDLILCADVIEHLIKPDVLCDFINRSRPKQIILSTPDRNCLPIEYCNGPPQNPCHVREWTSSEFRKYIDQVFEVIEHQTIGQTQIVLAKPKHESLHH